MFLTLTPEWRPPPTSPRLDRESIHVLRFNPWQQLDIPRPERLERLLSGEEKERAAAFRFERDRMRFIARRGTLRQILEFYTGIPAQRLIFSQGAHGKPKLVLSASSPLEFNLSDSGDYVLCALSREFPLGVDLEKRRSPLELEGMIRLTCDDGEAPSFRFMPPSLRPLWFFRLWSAKEAGLKALGCGLSMNPRNLRLDWRIPAHPRLQATLEEGGFASLPLYCFEAAPGYSAALAVMHEFMPSLFFWRWPE